MDCFYAAVEIRENPDLENKPVAVGGSSQSRRGVLCTCNYEARKFGVRSAMPTFMALEKCPDLTILPVRFDLYRQVSESIHEIFKRYTDKIEPLSLDEAYLDVSDHSKYATQIAREIRKSIKSELGLTASAGIASNKFLAKIASDWKKPNGQLTITPEEQNSFIATLPVTKIWGVGKVTASKLHNIGIINCSDLQKRSLEDLTKSFGSMGIELYSLSRGLDDRPVKSERNRKSLSNERTFQQNLISMQECMEQIPELYEDLQLDLNKKHYIKEDLFKIFIKLKFSDFSKTTAEKILTHELSAKPFYDLLETAWQRGNSKHVRLLGLGVRFKRKEQKTMITQLELPLQ